MQRLEPAEACERREPSVVFLPALGFTGPSLAPTARRLSVCGESLLVDLPGTGGSAPRTNMHADEILNGLARLLAQQEEVILVGHSIGGTIAVRLAVRLPSRVRALVLIDAPVAPFTLNWWQWTALHPRAWLPLVRLVGAARVVRHVLAHLNERTLSESDDSLDVLSAALASRDSRAVMLAYYEAFLREDALERTRHELARLNVPVLVLWGAHDAIVPPSMRAEIRAALPPKTPLTTRMFDAGHLLPLELPGAIARVISEFVRALGAR